MEIRQDLSAVLDEGRIHRDRWAAWGLGIRQGSSAVWAVGRIRLGPLVGSASAAATASGCCVSRVDWRGMNHCLRRPPTVETVVWHD